MAVAKIDPKVIFASGAPAQDTPAVFTNKTVGWGESRKNGGRPTIKQSNALQQETDLKILWLNENSVTPFDATIDYPENAVTIKDGVFKILKLGVWELFLDKSSVGLSNVDNTSDLNKPVSTATQVVLNLKADKSTTYTKTEVNNALDLLKPPYSSSDVVDGNQNQEEINLYGAKTYDMPDGGYPVGGLVRLDNGDIVKSTIPNNINDPNVDMVGWVSVGNTHTVNSVAEMLLIQSPRNKMKVVTHSYYFGAGRGSATYTYDSTKAGINNGITILNGWVLQWDGKNLDLLQAGCYADGITEDGVKIGQCLDILYALGGGSLQGRGFTYLNETTNYAINTDNIFVVNAKIIRNGTLNNWMFRTATTKEISGGGFINVEGKGNSTVAIGSAFINMGSNDFKHNKWVLQNIIADNWSQYGVGINAGDFWYANNIKVFNHGLTVGTLSSCMGFYVYPRNIGGSKGGVLNGVYSEMSAGAIANASLNSAAIKLQTHQIANFSDITAIGGFEQCLGIDSVDGNIKDVFVFPQGERPGLVLGNYNNVHAFSGQKFTLDGFRVNDAAGSSGTNAMLIGAGEDGQYKLDGCTIRNGSAKRFKSLTLAAYRNCTFENIKCEDIRLSASFQSLTNNSVLSTSNMFINVRATDSVFAIETHDSEITDSGNTQKVAATGAVILGNGNIFKSFVGSTEVTPLAIRGNNNTFISPILKGVTRAVWFQAGTTGNKIISPIYLNSAAVLNNGDATNKVEFVKASGLTSASTPAQIVSALQTAGLAT